MTISAKLFSILTTSFRGEDFKVFQKVYIMKTSPLSDGNVLTDQIRCSYFCRGSPNYHFYPFILISVH